MERKLPVKVERFDLNGDYAGWYFEGRVNPPWGQFIDKIVAVEKADQTNPEEVLDRLYDLIEMLATDWNYVDEKGKAIPFNRKGFRLVPLDLLHITIKKAREAIEKVPLAFNET